MIGELIICLFTRRNSYRIIILYVLVILLADSDDYIVELSIVVELRSGNVELVGICNRSILRCYLYSYFIYTLAELEGVRVSIGE